MKKLLVVFALISFIPNMAHAHLFSFLKSYNTNQVIDAIATFKADARSCELDKVNHSLERIKKRITKAKGSVQKAQMLDVFGKALLQSSQVCRYVGPAGEAVLIELEVQFIAGAREEIAQAGGHSPTLARATGEMAAFETEVAAVITRSGKQLAVERADAARSAALVARFERLKASRGN